MTGSSLEIHSPGMHGGDTWEIVLLSVSVDFRCWSDCVGIIIELLYTFSGNHLHGKFLDALITCVCCKCLNLYDVICVQ